MASKKHSELCCFSNSSNSEIFATVFKFYALHIAVCVFLVVVVVVVVYFILSRLLYLAFSANLGLLCMPNPGMGPLV